MDRCITQDSVQYKRNLAMAWYANRIAVDTNAAKSFRAVQYSDLHVTTNAFVEKQFGVEKCAIKKMVKVPFTDYSEDVQLADAGVYCDILKPKDLSIIGYRPALYPICSTNKKGYDRLLRKICSSLLSE